MLELMDMENTQNFLKSYERMVQATFLDFKLDSDVLELQDIDGLPIEKLTHNLFDYNFVNLMILCKNYLKTITLGNRKDYPEESVERQLCAYRFVLSDEYKYYEPRTEERDLKIIAEYLFKDGRISNEWIEKTEGRIIA